MKILVPLADRLVVENITAPEKTGGGVFLPDQSQMKPQEGFVCAVGPDVVSSRLVLGERIIYSKFAGSEVKLDGTEFLLISERDVLAVVKDITAVKDIPAELTVPRAE